MERYKNAEDKDLIPKSKFCAIRFNVQGSVSIIKKGLTFKQGLGKEIQIIKCFCL